MNYTQLTDHDVQRMLSRIGVSRIADLFKNIPAESYLDRPLCLPPALTEIELLRELDRLASANRTCDELTCFLGAGMYDHFIPTVVDALANQSEFVTAYTPYQAEASQGSLQAFYEYQTLICQLTGMDVSNASLYDGATAAAEAILMARSHTGRRRVVVSQAVHPDTRALLATYLRELPLDVITIQTVGGRTDVEDLRRAVNDETAAVLIQTPNFFGCVESLGRLAAIAHERGAVVIASVDPISCALLKTPGELGADIVVGDGQPLGIPMSYGGPSLGFMGCRSEFMRKIPGRLVGATTDRSGRRAYCLTLQTREQHIRRERATSNICTNQGLLALRLAIYLSAVGRRGAAKVASLCLDKAHYAASQIAKLDGFELRFDAPFFKEFAVRTSKNVQQVIAHCRSKGILAGVELSRWYDEFADTFLVAVTEKRTKQEIDALVEALDEA
ncbi:MAG TPA: aminomethyl-transferring glycine dehydrogenase subunit GcvPA [Phycisphaerae bacterium]|nr:aminomethyl-transferring glycine dehydrogenase subunit GcvPA [Phycisphaerae bacterium]HOQ85508.1 aminomethyl-transferring glycine dehydrogenase subunit GcvPA [Phycisphaerae bacterium]HPZ99496.1 aminomethyl-transferring glycine dehydrogenase subunit GcvPA [Phycisphaerae bacterium]